MRVLLNCIGFKPLPVISALLLSAVVSGFVSAPAYSSELNQPWKNKSKALVLDAYEFNALNWMEIVKDKRIAGFIGKASDGLPAKYCAVDSNDICTAKWRRYVVSKELYHTRRQLAKALGLKWGAYHLARPNNPIEQAQHFLRFTNPSKDDAIVLDIEGIDSKKFMSLEDAETFAKYIKTRIGRYPLLYTNHATSSHIAYHKEKYPILSRLKLWYARYKSDVTDAFPMGNWDKPALWQFAYYGNCSGNSCPYRVKGAPKDIDVNASLLSVEQLQAQWPFDGLHDAVEDKKVEEDFLLASNVVGDPEAEKYQNYKVTFNHGFIGPMPVLSNANLVSYTSN